MDGGPIHEARTSALKVLSVVAIVGAPVPGGLWAIRGVFIDR